MEKLQAHLNRLVWFDCVAIENGLWGCFLVLHRDILGGWGSNRLGIYRL